MLTSLFACTRAKTPRALHWNIGCRRFGFRGIDEGSTSVKVGFITPLYFPLCDLYSKPESRWLCRVSWLLGRSSEGFHEKTMGYSPGALGLALLGQMELTGEPSSSNPFRSPYSGYTWEFPRIRGTLFWGPYKKHPTIWGTTYSGPLFSETPTCRHTYTYTYCHIHVDMPLHLHLQMQIQVHYTYAYRQAESVCFKQ